MRRRVADGRRRRAVRRRSRSRRGVWREPLGAHPVRLAGADVDHEDQQPHGVHASSAQPAWSRAHSGRARRRAGHGLMPGRVRMRGGFGDAGQTYRLVFDKVTALGPPVPSPAPQGNRLPLVYEHVVLRGRAEPEPGRHL